jgi:5-methyltetrahydropteroyltriglutamate--homocysteine methyltransferase
VSTRGIATTHVGSLPRTATVASWLSARENGAVGDVAEFDAAIRDHVVDVVRQQVDIGIDIVSDGETSKISYSTYVKDRLTGFAGDVARRPALDLAPYPELSARMAAANGGSQQFRRPACVGPIAYRGDAELHADLDHFTEAVRLAGAGRGFLNAASPGLVTAFQPNEYYETHADYVMAVADAMRVEYESIVGAGFDLQLDCPDLAMAGHTGFQHLTEHEFIERAELHVEAINRATANIDRSKLRMHVCWGNYEGPHDHDIEFSKILPLVLRARPSIVLFEAANARHAHEWTVWADARIPDDVVLVPGTINCTSNYVEHPAHVAQLLRRYIDIVGPDRVIAGTDCGFGTFAGIGRIDPGVVTKKLAALVAGARLASEGA